MPYPAFDHFLTRKSRAVWKYGAVVRASDGSFTLLKRTGDAPVVLSLPIDGGFNDATFRAARTRLYALRDEAKAKAKR